MASFATSASASRLLKLYGVPLSQPFRSVAWALLMKQTPFEVVVTVPFSDRPGVGAKHDDFRNKTRARSITVPLLQDGDDGNNNNCITESAAILVYLCESRGGNWADLYGSPGTFYKATIDSYCHWHHTNTRSLGRAASSYFQTSMPPVENYQEAIDKILHRLDTGWLSSSNGVGSDEGANMFIAGASHPSIADLLCYCELTQITMTGLYDMVQLQENYPDLFAWMQRMQHLPYHDHVHAAIMALGNINPSTMTEQERSVPFPKRLSAATKAGLKALKDAQQTFATVDEATQPPQSKL
ncbi:hypothetical protein ACA910_020315 [Epithemia clementina (nom. ined.)]